VAVGDGGREAYTAIVWGVLSSRERTAVAEAETVGNVEGEMSGPVLRGAVALPWSKTTSRTNGSRRNLGDLVWPAVAAAIPGCGRKARSRSCRGTGEGSDEPRSTDEAPEQGREERRRRTWREGGSVGGMADDWRCSGRRTGPGILYPSPACGSALRSNLRARPIAPDLRQEPGAGKPHAGICAGGREKSMSIPRLLFACYFALAARAGFFGRDWKQRSFRGQVGLKSRESPFFLPVIGMKMAAAPYPRRMRKTHNANTS